MVLLVPFVWHLEKWLTYNTVELFISRLAILHDDLFIYDQRRTIGDCWKGWQYGGMCKKSLAMLRTLTKKDTKRLDLSLPSGNNVVLIHNRLNTVRDDWKLKPPELGVFVFSAKSPTTPLFLLQGDLLSVLCYWDRLGVQRCKSIPELQMIIKLYLTILVSLLFCHSLVYSLTSPCEHLGV